MAGLNPPLPDATGMSDERVRVWLVERDYNDKGLVTLVYATPDGERSIQQHKSSNMLSKQGVTAATAVDPDKLRAVEDDERRERYASEAERVAENNDPDDEI
jgi:hypothetical protein